MIPATRPSYVRILDPMVDSPHYAAALGRCRKELDNLGKVASERLARQIRDAFQEAQIITESLKDVA